MTLIAAFQVFGQPFLVGDVVVSRLHAGQTYRPFSIPTHFDATKIDSTHVISDLKQKVVKVGERHYIAWSGSAIAAASYFRELEEQGAEIDLEVAINAIQARQGEAGFDLELIGLYQEKRTDSSSVFHTWHWDALLGNNLSPINVGSFQACVTEPPRFSWRPRCLSQTDMACSVS